MYGNAYILISLLIHLLQIGRAPNPAKHTLVLMVRQTEEEEAAELAEQVYRNKTFLNIPFYAGTGGDYIKHFQEAYASKKAADPKTAKKKQKSLTPAQFKREEAARVKAQKLLAAVPYGPQERPTAATGLLPMEVLPAARTDALSPVLSYKS